MKNKLFSSAVLLLTCIYSLGAQEKPDVGFSMGLHMGPVISKDISKRGQTLATVAKDHTLMIWGYPSYDFRKAINLPGDNISPVSYGVCAIIPTNPNIVLIADNTGDVYENDLYKRRIKKKDNGVRPINDDREGLFYDNAAESITTRYSFIAVDVEQGKVIDRVGSLSSKIADFVFSPDESFLLVVSNGEEAVLYDTWGLRQVSQFLFEDERILGARFLNKEELCFFTDINYYKFRISKNEITSVIEKERQIKRSIKRRHELKYVKIEQKEGIAYLLYDSWNLFNPTNVFAIQLENGEKIKISEDDLFAPTADDIIKKEGVRIQVSHGISNGISSPKLTEAIELSGSQRENAIRDMIKEEKIKAFLRNEPDTINNYLFEYRSANYALIVTTADGIRFSYPDCSGSFNKNGVQITNEIIAKGSGKKWIDTKDDNAIFVYPYSETPQIWKTGEDGFKIILPIEADAIYPWINEHHFVASLTDGSIRWYNMHTGKEELALFVSKEGNHVIWAPNGTYMSNSDALADRIEWRYRRFSNVITTRPVNERTKYYWPNEIKRLIEQLFNPDIRELSSRYFGTNEHYLSMNVSTDSSLCIVNYSINDYNPVKYGPYDLSVIIEDESDSYIQIEEYTHEAMVKGGKIEFSTPKGSRNVILELMTLNKNQPNVLAYDRKSIEGEIVPLSINLTCVGINDYSKFKDYNDLSAPIHDANAVKSVFDDMISRSITINNSELYYVNVTSDAIMKRIDKLKGQSSPETLSVFYFSGHGENQGGKYMFISDKEMIDISSILTKAESIPGNKLFIFDSCYSGASFNAEYEQTAIIASSDAFTQSLDGSVLRESPFTSSLIDIIQRNSRERKRLSLEELFEALLDRDAGKQKPQIYNNIGKISIFRP